VLAFWKLHAAAAVLVNERSCRVLDRYQRPDVAAGSLALMDPKAITGVCPITTTSSQTKNMVAITN